MFEKKQKNMPSKVKRQWPFIGRQTTTTSSKPEKLSPSAIPSLSLYRTISELPLRVFITCIVDKNLSALIISGNPTVNELEEAWEDIRQQYADAIGDHEHRLCTSLYKELAIMNCNFRMIILLVDLLGHAFMKELADELNDILNTSFAFDPSDPIQYKKELQRCLNRSKSILLDIELKEKQYKSIAGKQPGEATTKPTKEYFISILITLSDHAKHDIPDTISVFEFCERLKRFNHYVEHLESLKRKR